MYRCIIILKDILLVSKISCNYRPQIIFKNIYIYIWELMFPFTSFKVLILLNDKHHQIITLTLCWEGWHIKPGW